MKILQKLTSLYIFGLGFLIVVILVASISFNYIYMGSEKILGLAESMVGRHNDISQQEAGKFSKPFEDIKSTRILAYAFFSFALIIGGTGFFLIFYIYKKNIVEPLNKVASATSKMAYGQFEQVQVMSGSEIGTVAENFNFMGLALKNKINELEQALIREQNMVRTLHILHELSGSIISKFNQDEIMATIVSFSSTILRTEMGVVFLTDRSSRHFSHSISSLPKEKGDITELGHSIVREVISSGTPIRWDVSSGNKEFARLVSEANINIKNFMAVPVIIEGGVRGALILINKAGADGFTMQDEDVALMVSFQGGVAIEKSIFHEEVVQLAKTDGLTGLDNHRTFHEELDEEIKRARRYNRYLALLLIDIDYFKKFNDSYGHQSGDAVLKELSGILLQNLRSIDSAARYGGEEFTVILPETSAEGGIITAEKIKNEVAAHAFNIMGIDTELTISIGVAVFPDDAINKEGLIKAADGKEKRTEHGYNLSAVQRGSG
ncbi:MAG: diguanylate cyclase [Nitrospirae bacterium]|nr:diguanylate cyclase [Nitrospirota bacterium]